MKISEISPHSGYKRKMPGNNEKREIRRGKTVSNYGMARPTKLLKKL